MSGYLPVLVIAGTSGASYSACCCQQFERTLIVAEEDSFISYLEGCTAPSYDKNQVLCRSGLWTLQSESPCYMYRSLEYYISLECNKPDWKLIQSIEDRAYEVRAYEEQVGLWLSGRRFVQLHAAVVELSTARGAEIKYSTVQNWFAGDANGVGGIYNFVTKRGLCHGANSKISWTQVLKPLLDDEQQASSLICHVPTPGSGLISADLPVLLGHANIHTLNSFSRHVLGCHRFFPWNTDNAPL